MALLLFDYKKLVEIAKNNPHKIVSLLKQYHTQKTKKTYIENNLNGSSFILHPEKLFRSTVEDIFKAQYIILAARRDYIFFKLYGITSLNLSYFPDINLEKIKHNPLLTITKTEIKFKYEDN